MAEPTPPVASSTPAEPATPSAPASPASPATPPEGEPKQVPYDRFKEVNDKNKAQEEELIKFREAERKRKEQEQLDKGEHEKVIADLRPKAERAAELETALKNVVDAEINAIPKDRQSLVPDLPLEKKLAWITANRAILMGKEVKGNVNHPVNPADASQPGGDKQTFTNAQIKDPAFYEKHKDAIIVALREGRIVD